MHSIRVVLLSMMLSLFCATATSAEPFAYVFGVRSGTLESVVTVIDVATNAKVGSVPLAQQACGSCFNPQGIAASRDGSRVYVSNELSGTVSVLDTRTASVIATFVAGPLPRGLVVSPDGSRLYVLNSTFQPTQTAVRVLDTSTGALLGIAPLSVPTAFAVAVTPDGSLLYVTTTTGMAGNDVVKVVSTASNSVIASIPVGNQGPAPRTASFPVGVDVSPDGAVAYVAVRHHGTVNNISFGSVVGISTATQQIVSTTNVNVNPHPVRVSPDGASIYVAHNGVPFTTAVISRATNTVVASIPGTDHAHGMALSPDGTRAYVTNHQEGFVYALNLVARTRMTSIPFNAAIEGVPEAVVVTSPPVPVRPPTNLSATSIVGNTVTLQWTPPSTGPAPTQYVVEGGLIPGQVLGSLPTGSPNSTFTFSAPFGTFFVRVHSLAGISKSDASNEIQITVARCTTAPGPPSNLQVSKAGNVISVSWDLPTSGPPPTGYMLNVTGAFNGSFPVPTRAVSGTAGPGTYGISVSAINDCGASAPTAVQTVTIP